MHTVVVSELKPLCLKILLWQQDNYCFAQCLNHDICTKGSSYQEAARELGFSIAGYVHIGEQQNRNYLDTLPAAPKRFWDAWDTGSKTTCPVSGHSIFDHSHFVITR